MITATERLSNEEMMMLATLIILVDGDSGEYACLPTTPFFNILFTKQNVSYIIVLKDTEKLIVDIQDTSGNI